jgi:bacteriocin-like protein
MAKHFKNRTSVMAVTAARIAACHYVPHLAARRKIMDKGQTNSINTNATTRKQVRKPSGRELTDDQLNQITGGTVPSIPIPPPSPGIYAIGQIEARFPR